MAEPTATVIAESVTPTEERIGEAVLTGECHDTVALITGRGDCDVCLMIDQHPATGGGRHALARLTAEQASAVAHALLRAAAFAPLQVSEEAR